MSEHPTERAGGPVRADLLPQRSALEENPLPDCPPSDDAHPCDGGVVDSVTKAFDSGQAIHPENLQYLLAAVRAFSDAERYLKSAEFDLLGFPLYIPTVNELRYYGFHINRAFSCSDVEEQREELRKAERHCRRAAFDAVELCLLSHMDSIQLFQKEYRKLVITEIVPDYASMCEEAARARDFLDTPSHEQRADYYEDCLPRLEAIKKIARKLEFSRSSLNARAKRARYQVIGTVVLTLISAVGVLAALVQAGIVSVNREVVSTAEMEPAKPATFPVNAAVESEAPQAPTVRNTPQQKHSQNSPTPFREP